MRAWYLPMCVSSARPFTSPMAYSHSSGRAHAGRPPRSACPARGRRVSRPRSSVRGAPADATSSSSPRIGSPVSSSQLDLAVARAHRRGLRRPRARPRPARAATARTCSLGERLLARDHPVGRLDQRHLRAERASTPGPSPRPPRRRRGSPGAPAPPCAVVISRLVQGSRLAQAVDRRDRARRCRWPPPPPCAADEHVVARPPRAARRRAAPCPRTSVDPVVLEPGLLCESSRSWMISSRRASTAPTSRSPVTASRTPGMRRTSAAARPGAAAPSRACMRRRSTRRPPGAAPRAPRSSPPSPSRPAHTSPAGPAPTTTTSKLALAHRRELPTAQRRRVAERKVGSATVYFCREPCGSFGAHGHRETQC